MLPYAPDGFRLKEPSLSRLEDTLNSSGFAVTCELNPPKGTDLAPLIAKAEALKDLIDGFNLTDSHASRMAMAPIAAAHILLDHGAEPVLQITTRDRNRIALQGDLLAAYALGVRNVVVMGGDPPSTGDHPDAKPVFDLYAAGALDAARGLAAGHDMAGLTLNGRPRFLLGGVVNPGSSDLGGEIARMEAKIAAGARFFQTQAIYEPHTFERFARAVEHLDAALFAGIIPLKSVAMAAYMNEHVPGITVPEPLIREIAAADDRVSVGIERAARLLGEIAPLCRGAHIMALGWEQHIPALLAQAGISSTRAA